MTHAEILDAARDAGGGYKVDIGRGERIGRVSSEWFNRPDDERYLSLSQLMAAVKGRAERRDPGGGEPRRSRAAGPDTSGLR